MSRMAMFGAMMVLLSAAAAWAGAATTTATAPAASAARPRVMLETDAGNIELEFFPEVATKHVSAFLDLTGRRFYDGLSFHRVVPGFVIQGGCPVGDGTGGPGYTLPAEFSKLKHERGTLSMARRGNDINSAGSQFFVCLSRERCQALDGQYTIFGRVASGMEVVDKIAAAPLRNANSGAPANPVRVRRAYRADVTPATQPAKTAATAPATRPSAKADDPDAVLAVSSRLLDAREDRIKGNLILPQGPGNADEPAADPPTHATTPELDDPNGATSVGLAYRNKFRALAGVKATKGGVLVRELRAGGGNAVAADGVMLCHYVGKLPDGTEFDSSYKRGQPAEFGIQGLIRGFQEAAPFMRVGGKYQLVIPPELGYGVRGAGGIPPNSTLDFTVEVISTK